MAGLPRAPQLLELETFCTAADAGSLGRAALRLGVSQSALSKRLHALEQLAGVPLLHRTGKGVALTPEGRHLYAEAQRLLQQARVVEDVLGGLARPGATVSLAASHSAAAAFVTAALADPGALNGAAVELVTANSQVVRKLVADGRAELGVAATRPGATPNPGLREEVLADDDVVCAVPTTHPWAMRELVSSAEFLATPMVVRDPSSNARWTVESVLRERGLRHAEPLVQAPTPQAAQQEAIGRNAPLLLSRRVLALDRFRIVGVQNLSFPRWYVLVLPADSEPGPAARAVIGRLRAAVDGWGDGAR